MNSISKVSEISVADLVEYLNLYEIEPETENTLNNMLGVAKSYVKRYTGQEDLDKEQDFVIAVLVLVQDMWDNRTLYVNSTNLNHVVETILGMHSINLL